jgi:hypothetical protein
MAIGRDLLDLPFAELVRNLAVAIADGQTALDRNSLETLKALADLQVDVLSDVTEIIERTTTTGDDSVDDGHGGTINETVDVTGARVRSSGVGHTTMSMLQAGLFPTFYQFTEASVEVKIAITMHEDNTASTTGSNQLGFLGLGASRAMASSVDYRTQNTYTYDATGSSMLRVTMRPVPPPSRLTPAITTINTFTTPPTVTTA